MRPTISAAPAGARTFTLPLDPLLTLAVIGLAIASIVTLGPATQNVVPANPTTTSHRQTIYLIVGGLLMLVLSRVDYARLRPLKNVIYALLMLSILAVLGLGHSAQGAQRAIALPGFSFQASELGKVLLDPRAVGVRGGPLATPARARHHRSGDARGARAGDVRDRPAGPRLGHGLHGDRVHAAVRGGHALAAAGRAAGARGRVAHVRARGRARGGSARAQAL